MSDVWIGAAFTAFGAIIGAVASSATTIIQGQRQILADMKKTAIQLALEDYRFRIQDKTRQVDAVPAFALIFYYGKLVELTAKDQLNKTTLERLLRDQWNLQVAANEQEKQLRARQRE